MSMDRQSVYERIGLGDSTIYCIENNLSHYDRNDLAMRINLVIDERDTFEKELTAVRKILQGKDRPIQLAQQAPTYLWHKWNTSEKDMDDSIAYHEVKAELHKTKAANKRLYKEKLLLQARLEELK